MSESDRKLFKDWFDEEAAALLAGQVGQSKQFDREAFLKLALKDLRQLEMQGRVKQFSHALAHALPQDKEIALSILKETLPPAQTNCESITNGWLQWPIGQFIADYGIGHFEAAFATMIELTKRFSSEFAIRPFLESEPEEVFPRLLALTSHPNPHLRRWCSEGVRTRLPWGRKLHLLIADPSPIWPILEALRDDEEKYVQKSIANNLNDLSKDHPGEVVSLCRRWMNDPTPQRRWIVKHALRTLIKEGNPEALAVIGYGEPVDLSVEFLTGVDAIKIGESIDLTVALGSGSGEPQSLIIDFLVHYVRQGGKTSGKVFKWKIIDLAPGERITLTKKHSFRPTSIRALYPGHHRIEIQVNGHRLAESSFELMPPGG